MAIDTRDKRASALCVAVLVPLPAPDAVVDGGDRVQVCWLYRGIVPAVVTQAAGILQASMHWGPVG